MKQPATVYVIGRGTWAIVCKSPTEVKRLAVPGEQIGTYELKASVPIEQFKKAKKR